MKFLFKNSMKISRILDNRGDSFPIVLPMQSASSLPGTLHYIQIYNAPYMSIRKRIWSAAVAPERLHIAGFKQFSCTIPVVMLATVVATTATLSSNSCKSASFFVVTQFTSVLRKQFAANDTFLWEANGCNRALALRNTWLVPLHRTTLHLYIFKMLQSTEWCRVRLD